MINSEAFDYLNEIYKRGDFIDFKKFKNFLSKNNIYSGVGIDSYALGLLSDFSKNNSSNLKIDNGEDTLEIKYPDNISLLKLHNGIIKGYIDLSFEDREVEENSHMMIRGFSIQGIFLFNLIQGLVIHSLRINNSLEINFGSHYKDKLIKISRCDIGELYIDGYTIAYNSGGNRLIIDSNIKNLKLENLVGFTNIIVKGNYDIGIFELNNINLLSAKEGRYIISNRKIGRLIINNIDNVSDSFSLSGVEIQELEIINSNLGNMSFFGCSIGKITIYNSSLINTQFNGVIFESYNFGKEYENTEINNIMQKDNYRQFKILMDKNGNHTEANKFFAKEMEYYEKTLSLGDEKLKNIFGDMYREGFYGNKSKILGEMITLRFSKFINEFGNNWLSPLFWIILSALFAVFIDGAANLKGDLNILLFCIFIFATIYFFRKNKISQLKIFYGLDRFFGKFLVLFLLLSVVLFSYNYYYSFNSLGALSVYLNPLGTLPEYSIINGKKTYITYTGFELFIFLVYRIWYSVLLWHLIIAAKRTTKR